MRESESEVNNAKYAVDLSIQFPTKAIFQPTVLKRPPTSVGVKIFYFQDIVFLQNEKK